MMWECADFFFTYLTGELPGRVLAAMAEAAQLDQWRKASAKSTPSGPGSVGWRVEVYYAQVQALPLCHASIPSILGLILGLS